MAKFYAIRTLKGEKVDLILDSWDKCKNIVNGNSCEYKSFKTKKEAEEYLNTHIEEEKEEDVLKDDKNIFYVDGSYLNDTIGWGFIYVKNNKEITRLGGAIKPNENTSRNITGELESCKMACRFAIMNGLKDIYIVNDYQGISSYVTGSWKPKTSESKEYLDFMNKIKNKIDVKFIKVKGHTGNKWNDEVDSVAKMGTYL